MSRVVSSGAWDALLFLSRDGGLTYEQLKLTTPDRPAFWDVAYANGRFIAVGGDRIRTSSSTTELCVVATSDDGGETWDVQYKRYQSSNDETTQQGTVPITKYLRCVAFGDGVWVAHSEWNHSSGGGAIYSTDNGDTWLRADPSPAAFGVTYGGGNFVAGSYSKRILTSPDGVTWTVRSADFTSGIYSRPAYNGARWAIGGESATAAYSDDSGATWAAASGLTGTTSSPYSTRYWEGKFWLFQSRNLYQSEDGQNYTLQPNPVDDGLNQTWRDVAWTGDRYVVVGEDGATAVSEDGVAWTMLTGSPQYVGGITQLTVAWSDWVAPPAVAPHLRLRQRSDVRATPISSRLLQRESVQGGRSTRVTQTYW